MKKSMHITNKTPLPAVCTLYVSQDSRNHLFSADTIVSAEMAAVRDLIQYLIFEIEI